MDDNWFAIEIVDADGNDSHHVVRTATALGDFARVNAADISIMKVVAFEPGVFGRLAIDSVF